MDKVREDFNAWARENPYMTRATHFDAWKAAIETKVVELPQLPSGPGMSEDAIHAVKSMREACAKAIGAAGLKSK